MRCEKDSLGLIASSGHLMPKGLIYFIVLSFSDPIHSPSVLELIGFIDFYPRHVAKAITRNSHSIKYTLVEPTHSALTNFSSYLFLNIQTRWPRNFEKDFRCPSVIITNSGIGF